MNNNDLIKAIAARGILERLSDLGIKDDDIKKIKAELWSPEILDELGTWSRRYLMEGHMWGDDPSPCAITILDIANPNSKILDMGCGYGRDSDAFTKHGHFVLSVDNSRVAVIDAQATLGDAIKQGNACILSGDIVKAPILQKNFDAVSSHRMIHLPDPDIVPIISARLAGVLRQSGILVMTARSPDDFNPDQMKRIDDVTAEYKDRPGHKIHFYNEERLTGVLSKHFKDFSFSRGQEVESLGNVKEDGTHIMTHYIQVMAHRKTDQEIKATNGNGHSNGISQFPLPSVC